MPTAASFAASRLVLARERRGFTQRKLADLVGVSDRMIKAYEAGAHEPSADTSAALAEKLGFPARFFFLSPVEAIAIESASFRALSRASASLRNRAVAAGTLALEVHRYFSERFVLPKPNVPDFRNITPQRAAESLRSHWGKGQLPIANLVHLVETHGVRVFSLCEDGDALDAFSLWRDDVPFIFLNTQKTPERGIFDVAHELGHLVLHRHGSPVGLDAEREADSFAGSLLLPEGAMRAIAPRLPTVSAVASLKRTWRASTAAIGYRLHELGLMSDWHYRQFNIELARRGRKNEPNPISRETSASIEILLAKLAEDGVTARDIARDLGLPVSEFRALTFGMQAIDGGATSPGTRRGVLHLLQRPESR